MRVIEPVQFKRSLKKKSGPRRFFALVTVGAIACYGMAAYFKPLPSIAPTLKSINATANDQPKIAWPGTGQAAFGAIGWGVLGESGAQTTAPMASIAKVMTALAVLKQKPLKLGEQGPDIVIDERDVAAYYDYAQQGGSVIPVNTGEKISEYQALQALLLPSANNMAFTLAKWAFGSEENYLKYAKNLNASLQLNQTNIADASGFSPKSTSTPHDLVKLGIAALQNPVIAEIVKQTSATIPVAGEIDNINSLLGQEGINGIKTGNTLQAGGCLLFSTKREYAHAQEVTIVGAVMGSSTLSQAMNASLNLLGSVAPGFHFTTVVKEHQAASQYSAVWGSRATARANQTISTVVWAGQEATVEIRARSLNAPISRNADVGTITVKSGTFTKTTSLTLDEAIEKPSYRWKLSNVF